MSPTTVCLTLLSSSLVNLLLSFSLSSFVSCSTAGSSTSQSLQRSNNSSSNRLRLVVCPARLDTTTVRQEVSTATRWTPLRASASGSSTSETAATTTAVALGSTAGAGSSGGSSCSCSWWCTGASGYTTHSYTKTLVTTSLPCLSRLLRLLHFHR